MQKNTTVTATTKPSKDFFISMLTRDIRLADCIFDLIDNSIDSVVYNTNFDPMHELLKGSRTKKSTLKPYKIEIYFNEKTFAIKDNAYGISVEDARTRVFRFGADAIKKGKKGGLSIYGIGMKRACYKIGNDISVESTTKNTHFDLSYNVQEWLNEPENWDLNIKWRKKVPTDMRGTAITIKDLHSDIVDSFKLKTFNASLLNKIGAVYSLFIKEGLQIIVNGVEAVSYVPTLPESKDVKSSRKSFEKDGVRTLILAGLNTNEQKKAGGWYVFCNGRMILEADKTENTGWGTGDLRKFHQAVNPFLGFVYFQSDKLNLLPWTTTKDDINVESHIYQYTLRQMFAIAHPIISLLGRRYNVKSVGVAYENVVKSTKDTELTSLDKKNSDFKFKVPKNKSVEEISYLVPTSDLKKVKGALGNSSISNADVGKYTFEYFKNRECK